MNIRYWLLIKILTFGILGVMIFLGGFGFLLPAIYALETPLIWVMMPIVYVCVIIGITLCADRVITLIKRYNDA